MESIHYNYTVHGDLNKLVKCFYHCWLKEIKIKTHFKSYSLMYFLFCIFSVQKNKMFNCLMCLVLKRCK